MLKQYPDKKLLTSVQALVKKERLTLKKILEHLQEIHRRRLYADLGYSSLFKYLVKELKYSEGAAARRVGALKLVNKAPEAKTMIAKGELNLTVASQAQSFTKNKNHQDTIKVLEKLKGKTKDQATLELFKLATGDTTVKPDIKIRTGVNETRLHVTLHNTTVAKLEKLKAIKKISTEAAIDHALDVAINEYKKALTRINKSKGTTGRRIPARVKKQVLQRAKNCCEFPGCDENRHLEFEHVIPYAKGGGHELSNIKLFCWAHNQRAAIKVFGEKAMFMPAHS